MVPSNETRIAQAAQIGRAQGDWLFVDSNSTPITDGRYDALIVNSDDVAFTALETDKGTDLAERVGSVTPLPYLVLSAPEGEKIKLIELSSGSVLLINLR